MAQLSLTQRSQSSFLPGPLKAFKFKGWIRQKNMRRNIALLYSTYYVEQKKNKVLKDGYLKLLFNHEYM